MPDNKQFFHESLQDASTIKDFLQALQKGLEQERIVLSADGQEMTLTPHSFLHFSIKATQKGVNNTLHLKIMWEDKDTSSTDTPSPFSISS